MKRIAHISGNYITNVSLARDDAPLAPGTLEEADALEQGYTYQPPPIQTKIWPDARAFLDEFTPQEKAAISLSTDETLAVLRLDLLTWNSPVHADDDRVITGLNRLVELGILTYQRRQEVAT